MNWTKRALLAAAACAAITMAGSAPGRAAEPDDAGLSAARSGVRDARDQTMRKENSEVRRAQTKCAEGKADCVVKPQTTGQGRQH